MSGEQQEVVAVFKDGSGFSVKEVNWKACRWRLEARKATTGTGDQVAANSGDSWEEGHGEVRVEREWKGHQSRAKLVCGSSGLCFLLLHMSRDCSYSQVEVWAGNIASLPSMQ